MATKSKKNTDIKKTEAENPAVKLNKLRAELLKVRLDIRAGKTKDTNAHKQLKRQIAALLTNTSK